MKTDEHKVTTIGITGTIGSGKSTVGKILTEQDIPVIDTDKIAHELLRSDTTVKESIKKAFPSAICNEEIDRKELGKIVFKDSKAKAQLEAILHPRIRAICLQQIKELASGPKQPKLIATLIPLLFENNRQSDYDQTWAVIADEKLLRKRIMKRDSLSMQEIDLRLAGQMSQQEKARLADKVLDNSQDEEHLRTQVLQLLASLH